MMVPIAYNTIYRAVKLNFSLLLPQGLGGMEKWAGTCRTRCSVSASTLNSSDYMMFLIITRSAASYLAYILFLSITTIGVWALMANH